MFNKNCISCTETEKANFDYVPRKLNKIVFEKIQRIEANREALILENKRRQKSMVPHPNGGRVMYQPISNRDRKYKKSSDFLEKTREIHEAYQVVVSEHGKRVSQRRKTKEYEEMASKDSKPSKDVSSDGLKCPFLCKKKLLGNVNSRLSRL